MRQKINLSKLTNVYTIIDRIVVWDIWIYGIYKIFETTYTFYRITEVLANKVELSSNFSQQKLSSTEHWMSGKPSSSLYIQK